MARIVPEPTARYTIPKNATLPAWDLILRDGRVLRYHGTAPVDGPPVRGADGKIHTASDAAGKAATVSKAALSWWTADDGLRVSASLSDTKFGTFLHVVCSYADHDPSWDDIKLVRSAFYPDRVSVAMLLPPAEVYVNIFSHAFQLYQIPVDWVRAHEGGAQIDADGRVLTSRRLATPSGKRQRHGR